jgi:hypothetical protein
MREILLRIYSYIKTSDRELWPLDCMIIGMFVYFLGIPFVILCELIGFILFFTGFSLVLIGGIWSTIDTILELKNE